MLASRLAGHLQEDHNQASICGCSFPVDKFRLEDQELMTDAMNMIATPHRLKRKYGFSSRHQLDTVSPLFVTVLAIGTIVGVALWCALSDDSPPGPVAPIPAASDTAYPWR